LSVVEANLGQNRRALNALALYWKKEEELALIREENILKYTAKSWFSNRQISAGFGTMLTPTSRFPILEANVTH